MKINKNYYFVVLVILFAATISCDTSDSSIDTAPDPEYLVSYDLSRSITQQQLMTILNLAGQQQAEVYISYDLDIYRIVYNTIDLQGEPVEASGAIIVPREAENPGLLAIQHATIFSNDEAPSVDSGFLTVINKKSIFASQGYITFLPDYLGYGSTADLTHPFQHRETLASASYDMIKAGLEFIEVNNLTPSDYAVNMIGYSEGAYATLALAERVEKNSSAITPGLISMGGGLFDITKTAEYLVENISQLNECVACYAFFIYAYHQIYNLEKPLGYYFQSPFEKEIENGLFLGNYSISQINSRLPEASKDLFKESFLENFAQGNETDLRGALSENDLFYTPQASVLITHGTNDRVAPIFNSDEFYDRGRAAGKNDITYVRSNGETHGSGFFTWAIETLEHLRK
jgi:pimeloyl-ACP methyl ester carboxylesterase